MKTIHQLQHAEIKANRPWCLRLKAARQRCNDKNATNYKWYGAKGIKCELSLIDVEKLWFRDKAYEMKRPSLDRKEGHKNYTFDNCQFIEHKANVIKRNMKETKPVFMCIKEGEFIQIIKEFKSINDAARYVNRSPCSISDALNGRSPKSAGFIWRYKCI